MDFWLVVCLLSAAVVFIELSQWPLFLTLWLERIEMRVSSQWNNDEETPEDCFSKVIPLTSTFNLYHACARLWEWHYSENYKYNVLAIETMLLWLIKNLILIDNYWWTDNLIYCLMTIDFFCLVWELYKKCQTLHDIWWKNYDYHKNWNIEH